MQTFVCSAVVWLAAIWTAGATCLYPPPIASQADADQFSICPTVTGDITIATNVVGNIKIDGPKVIEGNLISAQCLPASNCSGMKSLSSSTLQTINADFSLQGIENLTCINFPALETVQNLIWLDLMSLETVSFDAGLGNATGGTIHMEGMSALQNLSGLTFTQIDYLSLQTGPLTDLILLVEEASELFSVGGDGNLNLDVSALKSTSSLTIFGCSQVNLAAFTTCANVDFEQNTFSFLSMPEFISSIYTYLTIGDNADLTSLSLPGVQNLDTLWVWGNPELVNLNGFSTLTVVEDVKVSGNFTQFTLPAATKIGEFVIDTSDSTFDCSAFYQYKNTSIFTGFYECQGDTFTMESRTYRLLPDRGRILGGGLLVLVLTMV